MQTMYYFAFGLPGPTESIVILIGLVLWVELTPNGRGFGSTPAGIGGSGGVSVKAKGTMTVG